MSPNTLDKDKARAILNTELNKYKENHIMSFFHF